MRDARLQKALIIAAIAVLGIVHWFVPHSNKQIHNLLYHLDFLPIVSAGMLFGWRSAAATRASVTESSAVVGSCSTSTGASLARARASASRCR